MSEVRVLSVPEGSIIWLHDVMPPAEDDDGFALQDSILEALREKIGHDRYVVLVTGGERVVDVLGPDELVERVRAALNGCSGESGS